MHVERPKPEAVHGREMADRIARVAVDDELRPRRGARGEIDQHRIVGVGRTVRGEARIDMHERGERPPAVGGGADGDAHGALARAGEFRRVLGVRHDELRPAALDAVGDVRLAKLRGRGDEHEAELDRGEDGHPEFRGRAEHHQEPVAALGAGAAQAIGEARRGQRKVGEAARLDGRADDFQREVLAMLAGRKLGVEPVERPVEGLGPRPDELGLGGHVAVVEREQQIARLAEGRRIVARRQGGVEAGHGRTRGGGLICGSFRPILVHHKGREGHEGLCGLGVLLW